MSNPVEPVSACYTLMSEALHYNERGEEHDMSNLDELKRFENDLKNSEELQKKLDEAAKRIVAEGKAQNDGEVMAAAANCERTGL